MVPVNMAHLSLEVRDYKFPRKGDPPFLVLPVVGVLSDPSGLYVITGSLTPWPVHLLFILAGFGLYAPTLRDSCSACAGRGPPVLQGSLFGPTSVFQRRGPFLLALGCLDRIFYSFAGLVGPRFAYDLIFIILSV